jgi:hypothetical protein
MSAIFLTGLEKLPAQMYSCNNNYPQTIGVITSTHGIPSPPWNITSTPSQALHIPMEYRQTEEENRLEMLSLNQRIAELNAQLALRDTPVPMIHNEEGHLRFIEGIRIAPYPLYNGSSAPSPEPVATKAPEVIMAPEGRNFKDI